MAYQTTIYRLFNNDYRYFDQLPEDFAKLRNILLYNKPSGVSAPSNPISRILKIVYETPFQSYLKVFVDNDIQFDSKVSPTINESFDMIKLYSALVKKEGWLEDRVFTTSQDYVPSEIWTPLRERLSQYENAVEVIAISTVIFLLVANRVSING